MTLDGRQLDSNWNGIQATGEGTLEAYGNAPISWTVTCLWDSQKPEGGSFPDLGTITHLLTLKLRDVQGRKTTPAFTISYKQFGQPSILRFEPLYTTPTASNADYPEWRTPAFPFVVETPPAPQVPEIPHNPTQQEEPLSLAVAENQQKSLEDKVDGIKSKLNAKVHSVVESLRKLKIKFCPNKALKAMKAQAAFNAAHDAEQSHEEAHDELDADAVSPEAKVATIVHQHSAAQTRALHDTPTSTSLSANDFDTYENGIPSGVILKSFFLSLIVLSCLTWIILRYRDPRRRAERAAYLEECRTKRLYRRAARRQKVVNMIRNFRLRYGLVRSEVLQEDEKRRRVIEQEGVLENVVKDGIQALRDAHRAVVAMTSRNAADAEEGRAGYVYEVDGVGHRRARSTRSTRSVSTLPEYESEGSRPPSYRGMSRRESLSGFTSDSSVVSTSPRISRDGTNSDYDEKVEDLSLDDVGPEDMRRRL